MISQRYFRSSREVYESVRLALDAAWGHPESGIVTCYDPADVAPRDAAGRILLAVRSEFCDYPAVAVMLPELLGSGAVEEVDEATYQAAMWP